MTGLSPVAFYGVQVRILSRVVGPGSPTAEAHGLEPCQYRFESYSGHLAFVAEFGRRAGFKNPCPKGRTGSNPV